MDIPNTLEAILRTTKRAGVPGKVATISCIDTSRSSTDDILEWITVQMDAADSFNLEADVGDWKEIKAALGNWFFTG